MSKTSIQYFSCFNIDQQEASGNSYFSAHALRLFVFHSLDLRNKG